MVSGSAFSTDCITIEPSFAMPRFTFAKRPSNICLAKLAYLASQCVLVGNYAKFDFNALQRVAGQMACQDDDLHQVILCFDVVS